MRPKRLTFYFSLASSRKWLTRSLLALLVAFLSANIQIFFSFIIEDNFLGNHIAKAEVSQISPIVNTSSAQDLVEQGRKHYEAGQFSDAVTFLQQAVSAFATQKDSLRQAMTLSNLSLAYQQLGQWQQADKAVQESLNLLQTGQNINSSKEQLKILAQSLEVQGRLQLAIGQAERALDTWQQATNIYQHLEEPIGISRTLNNQSQAMQHLGFYRRSLQILIQAYQLIQPQPESLLKASILRNIGDALRVVGNPKDSNQSWLYLQQNLEINNQNNLEQSYLLLQKSLEITRREKSFQDESAVLLSLGDTARAFANKERELSERTEAQQAQKHKEKALQDWIPKALDFYRQAANRSTLKIQQVQGQLNELTLLLDLEQWLLRNKQRSDAEKWWGIIQPEIDNLPQIQEAISKLLPSRATIEAQINFNNNLIRLQQIEEIVKRDNLFVITQILDNSLSSIFRQILTTSIQQSQNAILQAKELKYQRAEADILGTIGHLYEQMQEWLPSQSFTEEALKIAQSIQASDIAYELQWQLGRIYKKQNNNDKAISAYEAAIESLKDVRSDLVAINSDIQFSFRDNVEPIYRELVNLLLPPEETKPIPNNLQKSLYFIESLQLVELENFLQCNLRNAITAEINRSSTQNNPTATLIERINQVVKEDSKAALIYPIILPDQVAVILKLPGQDNLLYHATRIDEESVKNKLNRLQQLLREIPFLKEGRELLHEVYTWLIEPWQTELETSGVKTLVFVLDGSLRHIPMAALYDGQEYLVQKKYNIVLAPSIQLLNIKPFNDEQLSVLIAGLTKERKDVGFPPLPLVPKQASLIKNIFKGSQVLLDEQFSKKAFQEQIKSPSYNVIHLATHGIFSSNFDDTFILTGDDKININELGDFLEARKKIGREDIDLLVLSACETAKGDKRATLGIAGVAVKSGASSTLAPLWFADQESTTVLLVNFYQELVKNNHKMNKAEALRLAQKSLLEDPDSSFKAPRHWATFVLVGSWL